MVDELTVECLNQKAGCKFKCQRQLLAVHLRDECLFTEEQCPNPDCDGRKTELNALELGVSTLAFVFPGYHCFSSTRRRISRRSPWRQPGALLAMSNICFQKLWLTPRCGLLQLWHACKPPMAAIGRECA